MTGSFLRRGDLPGRRFQPVLQSGGAIELLREPYRIDRRPHLRTNRHPDRPQPRPGQLGCGQPLAAKTTCYAVTPT